MIDFEASVKTLDEADIITTNTSGFTSTQFECLRIVPGTVVGNGGRNEKVWVAYEEFVRVVHYGIV